MKILITGANGMLGTAIKAALQEQELFCFSSKELDISCSFQLDQKESLELQLFQLVSMVRFRFESQKRFQYRLDQLISSEIIKEVGFHFQVIFLV